MRYVFLTFLILLQFTCRGQKNVYGLYFNGGPYAGISILLKKNDSCAYHVYSEFTGDGTFYGSYIIRKNRIHINIYPPPDTEKFSLVYKGDNVVNRTIKVMDCRKIMYVGATVVLNDQIKLLADTGGSVLLPPGLILKTVKLNYTVELDTSFAVNDRGIGNIEISVPDKYELYHDLRYDRVYNDWVIKNHRLYPIRKGKVDPKFFFKRAG